MLTMSIRSKLFLTLLTAAVLVVVGMFALIQWSFERGFLNYINALEQQRFVSLQTTLQTLYADQGSWEWLQENRRSWWLLLRENAVEQMGEEELQDFRQRLEERRQRHAEGVAEEPFWRRNRAPSPPDGAPRGMRFEDRVVLLDAEKSVVAGPRSRPEDLSWQALTVRGRTVGYLGLVPQQGIAGDLQKRFARDQTRSFALVSLIVIGIATLLSLPLAQTMVRRIATLHAGARRLISGDFTARSEVRGNDELSALARDFNMLAKTLEENEQDRKQWIADISHELRTPLAVMRGEIEALQDGVRPLSQETLASLHGEVLQLGRLVDDLYQLSLTDLGALNYRLAEVDLRELLGQVTEGFRSEFQRKSIRIEKDFPPPSPVLVFGDGERLWQLFSNLLDNGLKYTDAGGTLVLRLGVEAGCACVDLQDSAPGVAEEHLDRLFERLYRVEGSRSRETGGAGLGLAICRNIVAAHDGSISASPSPLGGLWIQVRLPLLEERK